MSRFGPHTEESKRKMSLSKLGKKRLPMSAEGRLHIAQSILGHRRLPLGYHHTEETKAKIGEANRKSGRKPPTWPKGMKRPTWVCEKLKNVPRTEEWKCKQRKAALQAWRDPVIRQRRVEAIFRASGRRPNFVEQKVLTILDSNFPSQWKYVGDGKLIIGGKCPDYWNGGHKLIELFGDFWHKGENPQRRIDHFVKHNYNCLVIWEHELADRASITHRIKEFTYEVRQVE